MKWLGLDFGTKRIGVAVCDGPGWAASGVTTIERRGGWRDIETVEQLAREHEVDGVVVGLPLNMDGSEGRLAQLARRFAELVHQRLGCPVHLWDERLTSFGANEVLHKAAVAPKKRRAVLDQVAAALILEDFLEAGQPKDETTTNDKERSP